MKVVLFVLVLLFGTVMTAQDNLIAFNSRLAAETINGRPRMVRIERVDYPKDVVGDATDVRHLQETTTYLADGRVGDRTVYHLDGSVSSRFTYDYAADGRLSTIRTYDTAGKEVEQSCFSTKRDEQEEIVTTAAGIVNRRKTVTKLDNAGRLVESTLTDTAASSRVRHTLQYDAEGQVIGERIEVDGPPRGVARVITARRPNGDIIATTYTADGRILAEAETTGSDTHRELSQTLFAGGATHRRTTIEDIVSKDEWDNWTQKVVSDHTGEPDSAGSTTVLYRIITYY